MTIQPSTQNFSMAYQASLHANQVLSERVISTENTKSLSTEQENTLQKNANAMISEQAENIKSNYQSAKDIDLTRMYYQQQQKLFDIYMQSFSDDVVVSDNNNQSAIKTLNDTYATLYELHHVIKQGGPELNNSEQDEVSSKPSTPILSHIPMDKYNSIMMPSNSSHFHLSA